MQLMHSTESTISTFRQAALMHGEATLSGNYKAGNKCYNTIKKCYLLLKEKGGDSINSLLPLLQDKNDSVATWAAYYLLPNQHQLAINTLQAIANKEGIIAFGAKTTLDEWQKGKLKIG